MLVLTDKQYSILLNLYHELNEAFLVLPQPVLDAFYTRLYAK